MKISAAFCPLATLPLLFSAAHALAEEPKKPGKGAPDPEAMMKVWQEFATPGEAHQGLKAMTGTWTTAVKMWTDPSQPPQETTGTAEFKMIMGDRYLEETFTGTMMGQTFQGRGITAFNNASKTYQWTWIDNMGTAIFSAEGTFDKSGKILTSIAEHVDPMTRKKEKVKTVLNKESPTKHIFEMYERRRGKDVKTMEVIYTKKS